jgi:hypothetical protein
MFCLYIIRLFLAYLYYILVVTVKFKYSNQEQSGIVLDSNNIFVDQQTLTRIN